MTMTDECDYRPLSDPFLCRTSGKVIVTVKLAGLWYEEMIQEIKVCITVNSSETSASVSRLLSYWKLKWNCKFHVIRSST